MKSIFYYETYHAASIQKNGIFIFDASPQLSKEELNEIERIGTYQAFENDLSEPTIEEIKEFYPICFAYHRLKSNPKRKILFYSNYTGRVNHSPGRYGNFFTHGVIFEADKLDFSFKHFFEYFKWRKNLTIEEDKNYKPNLNKNEYTYEENNKNNEADFKYFIDFLDFSERIQLFIKIFDEIFTFKILEEGKNITIIDNKDNLIDWMLCINYFLPDDLAELITFASYVKSPKHYPFKLTGVVPECNVSNLSDDFKIFNIKQNDVTEAKSIYTKTVLNIINRGNPQDWFEFKKNINNINYSQLTNFLNKYNYILNIGKGSSIDDYSRISFNLPIAEKQEIWSKAYSEELNHYNEIVKVELENIMESSNYSVNYYKQFSVLYEKFFKDKDNYRKKYLDGIIKYFLSKIPNHIINKELVLHILNVANCNTDTKNQLEILLLKLDSFSNFNIDDIESDIESILELDKKYNINSLNFEIPNIKNIMKFKDIIQEAKKDNFINEIRKHRDLLENLSVKEKRKLFLVAFNNDKYFLKKNRPINFSNYINLINKYLQDDYPAFWADFFDKNKDFMKGKDYKFHSLSFLKKKFVADIFLSEYTDLKILDNIDFTDEYTMKWIKEAVTEGTDRESVLKNFLEYFKNNRYVNNSNSWFSNLNPFK